MEKPFLNCLLCLTPFCREIQIRSTFAISLIRFKFRNEMKEVNARIFLHGAIDKKK